jgi:hypothetical protein
MVIIVALAVFILLFFLVRKHIGPAGLAMIAGVAVFEAFGRGFAEWILKMFEGVPLELVEMGVYVALVAGFPILLYLRTERGGLSGILRVAEAVIFSAILVSLISGPLAYFFPFDSLALEISEFIKGIWGPIVMTGVLVAYLDILVYHRASKS